MDYTQSVAYLYEVISKKRLKHSLETLIDILKLFSSPQEELKVIHVAGTNGKGSTCAMLTAILMESGYKVGTFTSPHLVRFNERFTINGECIDDNEFASLVDRVNQACDKYFSSHNDFCDDSCGGFKDNSNGGFRDDSGEGFRSDSHINRQLSFFEILTIMAFIYFKEAGVDFAVIETGMGGRLDSTNIITTPVLSVITHIGLDHMNILGSTLTSIAGEKAGIIKKNCPSVLYLNEEEVYNVIKNAAVISGSKLYYDKSLEIDISQVGLDGTCFSVKSDYFSYDDISLSLFGKYQVKNAVGALLAVRALNDAGVLINTDAVKDALRKIKWPGRMEIMGTDPLILLDGAHNIDGAVAFDETMSFFLDKRIILVAGMLREKKYQGIMERFVRYASVIIVTSPESSRALEAAELALDVTDMSKEVIVIDNCYEAMDKAVLMASKDDVICVTGSLYLVGALRSYLRRSNSVGF